MQFYEGLEFFSCIVIIIIPAVIMGINQICLKYYGFLVSIFVLLMVLREEQQQLGYLILYLFIMIHAVKIYSLLRSRYGRNVIIYRHFLIISILPLGIYKISAFFNTSILGFVGISYITFKTLQVIIETYDGLIKEIKVLDFLGFVLFFPTFSSGPIDRSRRFCENYQTIPCRGDYLHMMGNGLQKLCLGALYKFVISSIAFNCLENVFADRYAPIYVVGYAYCYGIYMFFDFAGYSMIAVGLSYILGVKTPDNFRMPFVSIDISDFWNRWYITLSHWFRDFVFSRFMVNAIKGKWFKKRLNGAAVGLIVNMLIMGIWHGLSGYYIIYGMYHGMLLAGNEIYQKKSKFYKRNKNKRIYKFTSWAVTLNLVMFGFLIFSGYANNVFEVYLKLLFR